MKLVLLSLCALALLSVPLAAADEDEVTLPACVSIGDSQEVDTATVTDQFGANIPVRVRASGPSDWTVCTSGDDPVRAGMGCRSEVWLLEDKVVEVDMAETFGPVVDDVTALLGGA